MTEVVTKKDPQAASLKAAVLKDFYAVQPPFGNVAITVTENGLVYNVTEPTLTAQESSNLQKLKDFLLEEVNAPLDVLREKEGAKTLEDYLTSQALRVIKDYKLKFPKETTDKILYYLKRDFLGYGKIDLLFRDANIEDISCDGLGIPIYVWHRNHESIPTNVVFGSHEELQALITRLAYRSGGQITVSRPILEGTLPEGYRVHLTLEEISKRGATFTIRKFLADPLTIVDLISLKALSAKIAAYLWLLIDNLKSILIVGPTASGKTTTLGAMSSFIRPEMKIVTIEEVRELRLPHQNWIPMVTRTTFHEGASEVSLFDLLKSALRQRPDYIIVGEVRGEEAYTLFQAISIGHGGLGTMHAEDVNTAIQRLLTRPMDVPSVLIPLMNVVVLISRVRIGDRIVRRVHSVSELGLAEETQKLVMKELFHWAGSMKDAFEYKGESVILSKIAESRQIPVESLYREMQNRETVLNWMADKGIRKYQEVAHVVREYYRRPADVLNTALLGGDLNIATPG